MYDLRIDNAVVHDGLGSAPFTGSVAVRDGRIVAVGDAPGPAAATVDLLRIVVALFAIVVFGPRAARRDRVTRRS